MISLCVLLLLGFHPFSPFTSLLEVKQGIIVPCCRRRKKRLGKVQTFALGKHSLKVLEQGHRQSEPKRLVKLGESETRGTGFPKHYPLLTLLRRVWVSEQLQIAVSVG